ncbi:MAG: hypothetical protein ACK5Z2_14960 [Bacteroidota bacterium]|jgi:hypothetical protein
MKQAIPKSQQHKAIAENAGSNGKSFEAPVVQRKHAVAQFAFADQPTATQEGLRFRTVSDEEYQLNVEINQLLETFQANPTQQKYQAMMVLIEQKRQAIQGKHNTLIGIVDEYEASNQPEQTAFFASYLADKPNQFGGGPHANMGDGDLNHGQIEALFNSLRGKTQSDPGLNNNQNNSVERSRFLVFMLQGMHDNIGVDQYRNLDRNLGMNRNIIIDRGPRNNLLGGVANNNDVPDTKKTDNGNVGQDANLLLQGGSGLGYLNQKFANGYNRTANPNAGNIGDVQVMMDDNDDVLPIFTGVDQHNNTKLFSGPKKMTVHHEIGHLNSMLEGKGGGGQGKKFVGDLRSLTDQEEMYNIWGGPRSDRAYGEELGVPRRTDHTSLIAYRGDNLGSTHGDFTSVLESAYGFTNTIPQLQTLIITEIDRLANSSWRKITSGVWFAPDGVKALRTLLGQNGVSLQQLQARAHQSGQNVDKDRHGFTQRFYDCVGGINVNNRDSLKTSLVALKQMVVPQAWGNGQ